MGWESRRYGSPEEGGRFSGLRRLFEGDNPLSWSLPLYSAWGIRVRVHLVFIIWVAVELMLSLARDRLHFQWTAMATGSLFALVLLHEYGHCIACRRVGGEANQILMWPLGGLAYAMPPHGWKPNLITTAGGPAVNLLLAPILAALLAAALPAGARLQALVFNPFAPWVAMPLNQPFWVEALWWTYYTNAVLFLFNVLVPMYPMDSGRILQALLWSRLGYRRATAITVNVGLVVAVILFIAGMAGRQTLLAMVALLGGFECWAEKQRLAMGDPLLGSYDLERGLSGPMLREREESRKRAERRRKEEKEQAELDRILAKIAATGMGSLSGAEKKWLKRATEKRRG